MTDPLNDEARELAFRLARAALTLDDVPAALTLEVGEIMNDLRNPAAAVVALGMLAGTVAGLAIHEAERNGPDPDRVDALRLVERVLHQSDIA